MLLLVSRSLAFAFFAFEDFISVQIKDLPGIDVSVPFCPMSILASLKPTVFHMPALTEHFVPVGVGVLNHVMIIDLSMIDSVAGQSPALPLCLHWIPIH